MSTTFKVGDYVVTGIGTREPSVAFGKVVEISDSVGYDGREVQLCRVRLDSGKVVRRDSVPFWKRKRLELVRVPRTLVPVELRSALDG